MSFEDIVAEGPTRSLANTFTPLNEDDAWTMSWNATYSFLAPFKVILLLSGDQIWHPPMAGSSRFTFRQSGATHTSTAPEPPIGARGM